MPATKFKYRTVGHRSNQVYLHRKIWEEANGPIPEGMLVDHINGDTHDNRLENLRLASRSQNMMNSKRRTDNKTGLKGLHWIAAKGRWQGTIWKDKKVFTKSSTDLLEVAAWIHRTRSELHGEYARIGK